MSEESDQLLETTNQKVHEQFDMLLASMIVQGILQLEESQWEIEGKSHKEVSKWLKEQASIQMRNLGYSPGFLQKRLLVYVFQLYEQFYNQYITILPFKHETPLNEIQQSILILASSFLDRQYKEEGLADICTFLKQDINSLINEIA